MRMNEEYHVLILFRSVQNAWNWYYAGAEMHICVLKSTNFDCPTIIHLLQYFTRLEDIQSWRITYMRSIFEHSFLYSSLMNNRL